MEIINWIEDWYLSQCDGDWEHEFGVEISNCDNPGWNVKIDLRYTPYEDFTKEWELVEKGENDWYGVKIENAVYDAAGDPKKLKFLLDGFREFVETNKKLPPTKT